MRKLIILATSIMIFTFSLLTFASGIVITIPAEVEVSGSEFKLGDIAEISGATTAQTSDLANITLEKSPRAGYSKTITKELVKLLIENNGFHPAEYALEMPMTVKVKAASQTISGSQIYQKIRQQIIAGYPYPEEKIRVNLREEPQAVTIPEQPYNLQVRLPNVKELGQVSIPVTIFVDGQAYQTRYLSLRIGVELEVLTARRDISRGDKIREADFSREIKEISQSRGQLIRSFADRLFQDSVAAQQIKKGTILTDYYLKRPYLISWNDRLQAEVIVGGIKVMAPVKALGRAKKGEIVMVENINSGYEFQAKVISKGLVRVVK